MGAYILHRASGSAQIYEKASTKSKKVDKLRGENKYLESTGIVSEVKVDKGDKAADLTGKFYATSKGYIKVNDVYADNIGDFTKGNGSKTYDKLVDFIGGGDEYGTDGTSYATIMDIWHNETNGRLILVSEHTFKVNSTNFVYGKTDTSTKRTGYVSAGATITTYDVTMYNPNNMAILATASASATTSEGTWYKIASVNGATSGTVKNRWILMNQSISDGGNKNINTGGETSKSDKTTSPVVEQQYVAQYSIAGNGYQANLEDGLRVDDLRGIFGIPHQFLPLTDPRIDATDGVGSIEHLGTMYAKKIVQPMPLLLITPGSPEFMSGYSDDQKETMLSKYLGVLDQFTLDALVNEKTGKFYSLRFNYTEYFYYVNAMCRSAAFFLGIDDVKLNGETSRTLGDLDWLYHTANISGNSDLFTHGRLHDFLGTYVGAIPFYIEAETSISDSFSNSTTRPSIADSINGLSDQARELNFIMGTASASAGGLLDKFVATDGASENLQSVTDQINSMMGGKHNILSNLTNHVSTIMSGGKMMFPEIWSDSSFSRDYSVKLKFISPSGDPLSIYLNCLVPVFHCMALVLPRQSASQAYYSPFLVRAFYKGIFNVDMGIITGMSFTKGSDGEWTDQGLPTVVEVSLDIKDLYEGMFMSKQEFKNSLDILSNITELDYIANMCGINVNEPDVHRTIEMYLRMGFVSKIRDKFEIGVAGRFRQWVNQKYTNIFGKF